MGTFLTVWMAVSVGRGNVWVILLCLQKYIRNLETYFIGPFFAADDKQKQQKE